MIYVKRDPKLIPKELLDAAEKAQMELDKLSADERVEFIKKKSAIWRSFKECLSEMSYGKCWYSETDDPQSFFDVDHFRPKGEAKRNSGDQPDEGYPWLAFSWDNFRFSAGRSNRLSTDEDSGEVNGKHSWFPLCEGSPCADWENRCEGTERPMLLDPTKEADTQLVSVDADGRITHSRTCVGTNRVRVKVSVQLYGLDLPSLKEARLRVMRTVGESVDRLLRDIDTADAVPAAADRLTIEDQVAAIKKATLPNSPYSLAAKSKLAQLGFPELIATGAEVK